MRILYITTIGSTMGFFKYFVRELLDKGHTVDIATNMSLTPVPDYYQGWGCKCFQISCTRNPLSKGNITAVSEIGKLVAQGQYDIVHCHTPIAAACTRVACRNVRKNGTKVIYTAHGFHFYQGAPLKNWLLFYPVEKICSYWTDVLVTINIEDYNLARKRFNMKSIEYVHGVGIDIKKFANANINIQSKRKEIDVPQNAFLILSVGELNENKNHQIVLKALARVNDKRIHYAIAGKGPKKNELTSLATSLGLSNRFHLLGYRNDIDELCKVANVFVFPSIREGLGLSVIEAMASGLPCIVSDIRGPRELIDNEKGGYLISPFDDKTLADRIIALVKDKRDFGTYNSIKAKLFDVKNINQKMSEIYRGACCERL